MAQSDRRSFIGGLDARTMMGDDQAALVRLWREKRGEAEPEDLSGKSRTQPMGRRHTPTKQKLVWIP